MGCTCTKDSVIVDNQKYIIISKIAEGGFGTIDLVENARTGHCFALKTIKCENRREIERISMENKYYKLLNGHPNIVKLIAYDIIEDRKNYGYMIYSVFAYHSQGNLQTELEANILYARHIKNDRILKLILGISNGLDHIHKANLAHRDLKPLNILLSEDRQIPVLTDFGSMTEREIKIETSRKAQEIEDWAAQNCSMFYKAPELFSPKTGSVVDEKADIWSLGCVMYSIMYNKAPFDYVVERGDSLALAVANANFTIPLNQPNRHEKLVNLIRKCIIVEPSSRDDMQQILSVLNSISLNEISDKQIV